MTETIEELEEKYFMLEMQDTWSSRDYKYAVDRTKRWSRLFELGKSC